MRRFEIVQARIMYPDGVVRRSSLRVEDGFVAGNGGSGDLASISAHDLLILPGIVDLHGDAFERLIAPRPSSNIPYETAIREAARQMVSNGITTAYFGLSYSWEPGLRNGDQARELFHTLEAMKTSLACDGRIHLRFEIYHLDAIEEVAAWIEAGRIDLLAFNDHMSHIESQLCDASAVSAYAKKLGLTPEDFLALFREIKSRRPQALSAIPRLAEKAGAVGVPMASHDEETPEIRAWYHDLGCHICEFPVNRETARAARKMGDQIVLGGPNVVQNGSLYSRLNARRCVEEGLCTILSSDYYYPSLLQAAFMLADADSCTLGEAWRLISANPGDALGLHDRGRIEPGRRADFIIVNDSDPVRPGVVATFVGGRPVYGSAEWWSLCQR